MGHILSTACSRVPVLSAAESRGHIMLFVGGSRVHNISFVGGSTVNNLLFGDRRGHILSTTSRGKCYLIALHCSKGHLLPAAEFC